MLRSVGPAQGRGPAGLRVQTVRRLSQPPLTDTHAQPAAPDCGAVLIRNDDEEMPSSLPVPLGPSSSPHSRPSPPWGAWRLVLRAAAAPPRLHNSPPHGSEQQCRSFCSQICIWAAGRKRSSLLQGTSRGSLSGAGRPYTGLASWCRLPQGPQAATTWPLHDCLGFLAAWKWVPEPRVSERSITCMT